MIRSFPRYFVPTADQRTGESNGRLYSIWKHHEGERAVPPMELYVTTFEPNVLKGPHLHKTRWDYFTCIRGRVLIVVRDQNNKYHEFISSEEYPRTVEVPANIPSATINLTNEVAMVTNLCNPAWHPDNEDNYNVEFHGYDFDKARSIYVPVASNK